jgi:phosphoglycolate phosphatase
VACTCVRAVLFDLDGTLVQTREASWRVFREVSRRHGLGVDSMEAFHELFHDNIFSALDRLSRDADHAAEVRAAFLEGLERDYHPTIVPGMVDVVRTLASRATLAVLSGNALVVVRRILEEHGLAHCFAHVFTGDVEPSKRRSIQRFLTERSYGGGRRCEPSYDESQTLEDAEAGRTILVTDTAGDVEEARACGIRACGVSWGMHDGDTLLAAGAEFVALWPQELIARLGSSCTCAQPAGSCSTGTCSAAASGACAVPRPAPGDPWAAVRAAATARRARRVPPQPSRDRPSPGPAPATPTVDAELVAAVEAVLRDPRLRGV